MELEKAGSVDNNTANPNNSFTSSGVGKKRGLEENDDASSSSWPSSSLATSTSISSPPSADITLSPVNSYSSSNIAHDSNTSSNSTNSILSSTNVSPLVGTDIQGLTPYEEQRQPRTPVTDDSTTTIQIRTLNVELTCPVCLGILHNTMTVMECLHRFCDSCISKCLRLGKKECPTCRVKLLSRRHLRPDTTMDSIIGSIYPNLEEYEQKEEKIIQEINNTVIQSSTLLENIEEGKKRQSLAKKLAARMKRTNSGARAPLPSTVSAKRNKEEREQKKIAKEKTKPGRSLSPPHSHSHTHTYTPAQAHAHSHPLPSSPSNSTSNSTSPIQRDKQSAASINQGPEIGFVLLVDPSEQHVHQLPNKYLRTSRLLTIRHLSKFLSKKFKDVDYKYFRISLFPRDHPLSDEITLDTIDKELWKSPEELTLYYRYIKD